MKHSFVHPHSKEISGVKLIRNRIYISCLSGSLAVLSDDGYELVRLLTNLGEIYSMSGDDNYLLTGHTTSNTFIQVLFGSAHRSA